MRRKTYSEALIEDLNRQINHEKEQVKLLREELHREQVRYDALTVQFERLSGELEEKNKIIVGLSQEVLRLKGGNT